MSGWVWVLLIIGVIGLYAWIIGRQSDALLKKYKGTTFFGVGKYLVGLEGCNNTISGVECVVAPNDFVFAKLNGRFLGKIPRNSIEEVVIDDKSQITQRLTATRMLTLGVFALAAPKSKKIKEWCVGVRWADSNGMKRNLTFEFGGSNPEGDANKAANSLLKYVMRPEVNPDSTPSSPAIEANAETKVCPFCAETIKAAAIVCRYCSRELSEVHSN